MSKTKEQPKKEPVQCGNCGGTGGNDTWTCPVCGGEGYLDK